jgi:hypothetical protein
MRAIKLPTRRPNRVNLVRDQAIERQIRALELIAERLGIIEKKLDRLARAFEESVNHSAPPF